MKTHLHRFAVFACFLLACLAVRGQAETSHRVTLFLTDSLDGKPIAYSKISIVSLYPNGSSSVGEVNGAMTDMYQTEPYPVGSVLTITVFSQGYQRKQVEHQVYPTLARNTVDIKMASLGNAKERMRIVGELTSNFDGIKIAAKEEWIRVYCLNRVMNVQSDETGYYEVRLAEEDIGDLESISIRVGAGDRYMAREAIVPTNARYHELNFNLVPNQVQMDLEVNVWDATTNTPISEANVRIYQRDRILSEGKTGSVGSCVHKVWARSNIDSLRYVVVKEGYISYDSVLVNSSKQLKLYLASEYVILKGAVRNRKEELHKVTLQGEGFPTKVVMTDEAGDFEFEIPRGELGDVAALDAECSMPGTFGQQTIYVMALSKVNAYALTEKINPRARKGPWPNQISFGLGLATGSGLNPLSVSLDGSFGWRRIPHLTLGVKFAPTKFGYENVYIGFPKKPDRDTTMFIFPLSLSLMYSDGPEYLPWLKFAIGTLHSLKTHQLLAGFEFHGRRYRIGIYGSLYYYHLSSLQFKYKVWGNPEINRVYRNVLRPQFSIQFIRQILW